MNKKKNVPSKSPEVCKVNPKFVILSKKTTVQERQNDSKKLVTSTLPEESLSTDDLIGALTESTSPKSAPVLSHFSSSHVQEYPSLGSANKPLQPRNTASQLGHDTYNGRHNSLTDDLSRQLTSSSPTSESVKSICSLPSSSKGISSFVLTSSKKYQPPAMKSVSTSSNQELGLLPDLTNTVDTLLQRTTDSTHRIGLSQPVQILTRKPTEEKLTVSPVANSTLSNGNSNSGSSDTSTAGITVSNLLKLKLAGNNAPKIISNDPPLQTFVSPVSSGGGYPPNQHSFSSMASSDITQLSYPAPPSNQQRPPPSSSPVSSDQSKQGRSTMNPNAPSWTPPAEMQLQQSIPFNSERWDMPPSDWSEDQQLEYQMQSQMQWNGFNPNAQPFSSKNRSDFPVTSTQTFHMPPYSRGSAMPQFFSSPEMEAQQPTGQDHYGSGLQRQPNSAGGYQDSANESRDPQQNPLFVRRSKSLLPDSTGLSRPMRPPSLPSSDNAAQPCLFCGAEATLECSTCAQIRRRLGVDVRAFFCSAAHQQLCWKQHHESVHQQYTLPQKKSAPVHAINPNSTPQATLSETELNRNSSTENSRKPVGDTSIRRTLSADVILDKAAVESASSLGNVPSVPLESENCAATENNGSSANNLNFFTSMLTGTDLTSSSEAASHHLLTEDRHLTGTEGDLERLGNSILDDVLQSHPHVAAAVAINAS